MKGLAMVGRVLIGAAIAVSGVVEGANVVSGGKLTKKLEKLGVEAEEKTDNKEEK